MGENENTLGAKIRKLREEKNLSQDRLSKAADLSLNTIVKIESKMQQNPTVDTLKKIAKGLGVSITDIID